MYYNIALRLCLRRRFTPSTFTLRSASNFYVDSVRNRFIVDESLLQEKCPIKGYDLIYIYPRIKVMQFISILNRNLSMCGFVVSWSFFNPDLYAQACEMGLNYLFYAMMPLNLLMILSRQTVGCMYYNAKEKKVLLSYLTFWGQRKNLIVAEQDMNQIGDPLGWRAPEVFRYIDIISPKMSVKMNVSKIVVIDREKYTYITGRRI